MIVKSGRLLAPRPGSADVFAIDPVSVRSGRNHQRKLDTCDGARTYALALPDLHFRVFQIADICDEITVILGLGPDAGREHGLPHVFALGQVIAVNFFEFLIVEFLNPAHQEQRHLRRKGVIGVAILDSPP